MKEYFKPTNYLILDNFFSNPKEAFEECMSFEHKYEKGLYRLNGRQIEHPIKENIIVRLDSMYGDRALSYILSNIPKMLWTKENIERFKSMDSIYEIWADTNYDETQISIYGNGGHYGFHVDNVHHSPLTMIIFLFKEPKKFTGGNIVLRRNSLEKEIVIKNNMALVFPSLTQHCVTEIKTNSDKFEDKRISVQYWAGYVGGN